MFKTLFTLTALIAISTISFAQNEKVSQQVTRTFGLAIMTNIHNEQDIQNDLKYPQMGFDFTFNKKVKGKIFEKGFSLGWQPINTTHEEVFLPACNMGTLKATNQMVHGYITVRTTALKNHPFQPYFEGLAGFKGAALTTSITDSDGESYEKDVPYFDATWNLGAAVGFRWEILNGMGVDLRYARISSGDLLRVNDYGQNLSGNFEYTTSEWKVPVGYLRLGVSVSI